MNKAEIVFKKAALEALHNQMQEDKMALWEGKVSTAISSEQVLPDTDAALVSYRDLMEAYSTGTPVSDETFDLAEEPIAKSHQTLLVHVPANLMNLNPSELGVYRERSMRFSTSLNTNNTIKSDIITLVSPTTYTVGFGNITTATEWDVDEEILSDFVSRGRWNQYAVLRNGPKMIT